MATPQGYYTPQRPPNTYNDYTSQGYSHSSRGSVRGGGFRSPSRSFSTSNPYAQQQYDVQPVNDHRRAPPPVSSFRGVMIDQNAPGGQAWAECELAEMARVEPSPSRELMGRALHTGNIDYAKGGTDPAGLVYFYPETVIGFPGGPHAQPQLPPSHSYASHQPQRQPPPSSAYSHALPASASVKQYPPVHITPQHHAHSQSVPSASVTPSSSYPYQQPPPTLARQPSYGNGFQNSPSPQGYVQPLPPVQNTQLPPTLARQRSYGNGFQNSPSPQAYVQPLPAAQHAQQQPVYGGYSTDQPEPQPLPPSTRTASTNARPLPQPRTSTHGMPQQSPFAIPPSISSQSFPSSSSIPVALSSTSSLPPNSRFRHESNPVLPFSASTNGVTASSSLRSTGSASSASSVPSLSGKSSRPLPTPSGAAAPLDPVTLARKAAQDAFAAVKARQSIAALPTAAPYVSQPPPPAIPTSTIPPAQPLASETSAGGSTSRSNRPTELPQPGVVKSRGGRPLPAPIPPSPSAGSEPMIQGPEGPVSEEPEPEPMPATPSRPLPKPTIPPQFRPNQQTEEEKRAEYKSEAQKRIQEKMKSFGKLRRRESDKAETLPTVVEAKRAASGESTSSRMTQESAETREEPSENLKDDEVKPAAEALRKLPPVSPSVKLPAVTQGRPLPPRRSPRSPGKARARELDLYHDKEQEQEPPTPTAQATVNPKSEDEVTPTLKEVDSKSQLPPQTTSFSSARSTAFRRSPSAFGTRSSSAFGSVSSRGSAVSPPLPSPGLFTSAHPTASPSSPSMPNKHDSLLPEGEGQHIATSTPSTPGLTDTGETSSATSVGSSEVDSHEETEGDVEEEEAEEEEEEEEEEEDEPGPAHRQTTPPPPTRRSPPQTPRANARHQPQAQPQSMALRMATMALEEEKQQAARIASASLASQSSASSPPINATPVSPSSRAGSSNSNSNTDPATPLRVGTSGGTRKLVKSMPDLDDTPPRPVRGANGPTGSSRAITPTRSTPSASSRPLPTPTPSRSPLPAAAKASGTGSSDRTSTSVSPTLMQSRVPAASSSVPPPQSSNSRASSRVLPPSPVPAQVPVLVPVINFPDDAEGAQEGPSVAASPTSSPKVKLSRSPSITITVSDEPSMFASASASTSTSSSPQKAPSRSPLPKPQVSHGSSPVVRREGALRCAGCERFIVGKIVSAMGRRWHPACFKCDQCNELLEHVSSYEHEGKAYCHLDYHELFAPRCYHCKTSIADERFITVSDPGLSGGETRFYHELHFFCAECGDPFLHPSASSAAPKPKNGAGSFQGSNSNDLEYTIYRGHPYCEACHR
ncbi:hypothetical protein FRB97_005693 [Tulasnella sp. 331]|nr:hypothetical protein FRB97_005693 [Tulasnella sp. 331]